MRSRTAAGGEAVPAPSGGDAAALADPRLLRIEQKLDRMARQMSKTTAPIGRSRPRSSISSSIISL